MTETTITAAIRSGIVDRWQYLDEEENEAEEEHDCLDCLNCDRPDPRMDYDGIGYCTKYFEFVDLLDSDLDKECLEWERR